MIDRSSFRFLDTVTRTCLNSTFSNNLSWDMCSFSESFSKVCDQGSNVSLDLWCVNFMFHQNWQVRMCCVVRFWAVWTFLAFFKKKLEHMHSELATTGEKINLRRERFSFRNILRWEVRRSFNHAALNKNWLCRERVVILGNTTNFREIWKCRTIWINYFFLWVQVGFPDGNKNSEVI